ncbi:MAG TPA: hypothetical protein VGI12_16430 [Vicinamibacterales bacterium]|jgi:hypothetical protein
MAESTRRVDLRLTIPASAPWREVAVELAVKFAEYVNAPATTTAAVSQAVVAAMAQREPRSAISLVFSATDGEVTVAVDHAKK